MPPNGCFQIEGLKPSPIATSLWRREFGSRKTTSLVLRIRRQTGTYQDCRSVNDSRHVVFFRDDGVRKRGHSIHVLRAGQSIGVITNRSLPNRVKPPVC